MGDFSQMQSLAEEPGKAGEQTQQTNALWKMCCIHIEEQDQQPKGDVTWQVKTSPDDNTTRKGLFRCFLASHTTEGWGKHA